MANPFVHLDLITGDVDKAKAFYGALFDWNLRHVPGMNYMIVKVGKGTCGGRKGHPDRPGGPSDFNMIQPVENRGACRHHPFDEAA